MQAELGRLPRLPAKPVRLKAPARPFAVPQSAEQANDFIARIGAAQRQREKIQTQMNTALAKVKELHEKSAKPFAQDIEALTAGLQTWCEAHRAELTRDGRIKTYRFGAGEISWRTRPPSVMVKNVAKVLSELLCRGLDRFVRTKKEIDKEAILAAPHLAAGVPGLKVSSAGEDFIVKPFATELEEVGKGKG
jgi:phage host-nuclease inhibitor protein Gam